MGPRLHALVPSWCSRHLGWHFVGIDSLQFWGLSDKRENCELFWQKQFNHSRHCINFHKVHAITIHKQIQSLINQVLIMSTMSKDVAIWNIPHFGIRLSLSWTEACLSRRINSHLRSGLWCCRVLFSSRTLVFKWFICLDFRTFIHWNHIFVMLPRKCKDIHL